MEVLYTHCAGIDVHKKTVVVCCLTPGPDGVPLRESRTFSTMTQDLLRLADWLSSLGITHVAMEATGEFWKPVYTILEADFTVIVANAHHMKTVPGRETDVKDAEWIAELLRHGLLRASFIPPLPQRDLRDLTRQRTNLVQDRATVVNRLQKVLEWANLKLSSVATDVTGVSARAMLEGIVEGAADAAALAELAKGRMRSKRAELEQALTGRVRDHHRYLLGQQLVHLDFLDEQIGDLEQQIATMIAHEPPTDVPPAGGVGETLPADPVGDGAVDGGAGSALSWADAVKLLDTITGVGQTAAEQIVAEIGTDMGRFASAAHLASWAKVCPGNHESAGKRRSGKTGQGNRWLRSVLIQAAWEAVKVKGSHLEAVYHRLAGRRG
ncbi:MAG TPA: IS110 family transposase [Herpetosiphonaceae bacterium]|nr:IS110 family transposase [Herpetosiphonaceae bacterium]